MALRRNLLLVVLAGLLAIVAYDHWPEPQPVDYAAFTALELLADESREAGRELRRRIVEVGPEAVEAILSHDDESVRASFAFFMLSKEASPSVADKWRRRFVRMIREESSADVHNQALLSLAYIIREDIDAEVPHEMMAAIRGKLRGSGRDRFFACMTIFWLGERVVALRDDLLAMDVAPSGKVDELRYLACIAVESLGVVDDEVVRYLMDAMQDAEPMTRSSAVAALGQLGVGTDPVVDALRMCVEDDAAEVRSAALEALSRVASKRGDLEHHLRVTLSSRDDFEEFATAEWLECVVRYAVRADSETARAEAVEALARIGEGSGFLPDYALAGAIGRIAIAGRDEELLGRVLPELMAALAREGEFTADDDASIWDAELRLLYSALVDLCLWRKDPTLTVLVESALRGLEETQISWFRKWCRKQLARLSG